MRKITEKICAIGYKLHKIFPAPKRFYTHEGLPIATLFKEALYADPKVDNTEIDFLMVIPHWLDKPSITDFYETDKERSDFEKEVLVRYPGYKRTLDGNRLRASQLRLINKILVMSETIFIDQELEKVWLQEMEIVTQNKEVVIEEKPVMKSIYELEYEREARLHYMDRMAILLKQICVDYIKSKLL